MDPKLLIIADLGLIKAYILNTTTRGTPHLEQLDEVMMEEAHSRVGGRVTDLAGRRGAPTRGNWGAPINDDHNLRLETRRRLIKGIAIQINRLAQSNTELGVWLVAQKEINHPILEALPKAVRQRIETSLSRDLAKTDKKELLKYFAPEGQIRRPQQRKAVRSRAAAVSSRAVA